MKVGDLVRSRAFDFTFDDRAGIILTWVRTGGTKGAVWEVLYPKGDTELWDEDDLEIINEGR